MAMSSSTACSSVDCSPVFLSRPPTIPGNAVLLAFFVVLIPIVLVLGTKYRSLGVAAAITTGLLLEVVGYVGRLLLHSHPHNRASFTIFLVGTTVGPTWICGAIFCVVPRIVRVSGEAYRSWSSVWYLLLLSVMTAASLGLELAGSIVSATQNAPATVETGTRVLVAGLAVQLAALAIFVLHGVFFTITLLAKQYDLDPKFSSVYTSTSFKLFLAAFTSSATLIILRTAYRTVQIAEGFQGPIARDETLFLILDGAVMVIAIIILLACFPVRVFGQSWPELSVRRLSQEPLRPIRQVSVQRPVNSPVPAYNRMSAKSSMGVYSPRSTNHWAAPPQRGMVDSDDLW
ncbi:hypothetical protein F5Y03DRAFT_214325 [Xylaria venustula]|nr:hypothetical protein F5Y03DRAFT_214325 [Xylaria venustula]